MNPTTPARDQMTVQVNDRAVDIPANYTIAQLIDTLSLRGGPVAVEWNLQLVPVDQHKVTILKSGDHLEIVSLTGGG